MDSASEALLIIVSVTLTVFLIVSIIALVWIIKILKGLSRITDKAEKIADQAEHVGDFFQKTAGSVALGKLVSNIISATKKNRVKDNDDE